MKNNNSALQVLPKEILEKNQDVMNYLDKISSILDRTHQAMGKKVSYHTFSSSTSNGKLNTNAVASTSKI